MWRVLKISLLLILFAGLHQVSAQNPNNALLYSYQSTLFSERGAASDPVSIIMPGTAYNAGLGSFLDNPASMALFDKSFMDFGFNYRMVEEDAVLPGSIALAR